MTATVTTTWNDLPPASPPMTDEDLCASWAPTGPAGPSHHDHTGHDHGVDEAPPVVAEPTAYPWSTSAAPTPPPAPPVTPPTRKGGARVAVAGLAVVGLLGVGFAARGLLDSPTQVSAGAVASAAPVAAATATPYVAGSDEEPVVAVAKALGPSVVLIKTDSGLGSGVVYDSAGLILTNAHVVGEAKTVNVQLSAGKTVEGKVLGADTANDIAVVQVQPGDDIVAARIATQAPQVGSLAVGIGSPFGLDETVTAGVVSAVNRPVDNENGAVANMIQTDAPINPGNSGGALANRHGELIGINSMIYSQKGENNGIGFAIPIERAKSVADKIVGGESVARGYLGVSSKATSDGQAGAEVAQIESGSPADQAGLKTGDVIVSIDGSAVKASTDLAALIGAKNPGDTVKVEVQRGGKTTTLQVTVGTRPASAATGKAPQGGQTDPTDPTDPTAPDTQGGSQGGSSQTPTTPRSTPSIPKSQR
jgi:putative serine protease PepD